MLQAAPSRKLISAIARRVPSTQVPSVCLTLSYLCAEGHHYGSLRLGAIGSCSGCRNSCPSVWYVHLLHVLGIHSITICRQLL